MTPTRAPQASPWLLAALLLAGAYWILALTVFRAGLPHPLDDIWEDGVVARTLQEGHGFRTTVIYPPLWGLRDPASATVPVLVHGPLLPMALALPLRLAGPGLLDHLGWAAAALAVLLAAQTFRLAARWFGQAVAAAAAALVTLSPILLDAVAHSLSVVMGACLLLAACDLTLRDRPRAWLAGVTLGLCYLVRPEMLLAAPCLALACRRAGVAARFAAGFAIAAAGWWWHQWRAAGLPMFSLSSYTLLGFHGAWPEYSILRDFDLTPDRWPATLRAALPELWHKWIVLLPRAIRHALTAPSATTGWLAALGAAAWLRTPGARTAATASILVAGIPLAMMTLAQPVRLYLMTFMGLYALGAARGAAWLAGRWRVRAPRWLAALALLALLPAVPALSRARQQGRLTAALLAEERASLAAVAGSASRAPMFTDRPDFVAWTTGRPALYVSRQEYERLYPAAGPAEAVRAHGLPPARDPARTWFHRGHWDVGERVP